MKNKIQDYYHGNDTPNSLGELISLFEDAAKRQVHGLRDNDKYDPNKKRVQDNSRVRLENLRNGEVSCYCHFIAKTMVNVMDGMRLPAREVAFVSAQNIPGDMGHGVFEVFFKGEYMHVDVDMGVLFFRGDSPFNSLDLLTSFDQITPANVRRLVREKRIEEGYPITYLPEIIADEKRIIEWYRPKMDSMIIPSGEKKITENGIIYAKEPEKVSAIKAHLPLFDEFAHTEIEFVEKNKFSFLFYEGI